jgi:hypothetical protein
VISCLGELGWLDAMGSEAFDRNTFGEHVDPDVFASIMTYLAALGLLTKLDGEAGFSATALGDKVFRRYGAFCILNSYEEYLRKLRSLLIPDGSARPRVERLRNVIGSGALHERKFFVRALDMLGSTPYDVIADIGCGEGCFLSNCLRRYPSAALFGADVSSVAIDEMVKRVRTPAGNAAATGILCNGANVGQWSQQIRASTAARGKMLTSLWFLLHEISLGNTLPVLEFLRSLRLHCPTTDVLIGEIVRLPAEVLERHRSTSVLPELTLIHDLSGQGLLSWDEWQEVSQEMPYVIKGEHRLDVVETLEGDALPSGFVWWLEPV